MDAHTNKTSTLFLKKYIQSYLFQISNPILNMLTLTQGTITWLYINMICALEQIDLTNIIPINLIPFLCWIPQQLFTAVPHESIAFYVFVCIVFDFLTKLKIRRMRNAHYFLVSWIPYGILLHLWHNFIVCSWKQKVMKC